MFDRLDRRHFTAVAAATLFSSPAALLASSASYRVSIALAARHSLYLLPLVLADHLGYFKMEGLQVDWVDCESGSQAVQMALSGQADVVSAAFEHVLDLQASGLPYKAFVLQARTPQISLGLASRRAATAKHITEFKSLKIGISSIGSATHWVAQHWLRQVGFSLEAVHYLELGGGTAAVIESMRAGELDALCHVDPIVHYLEQKNDLRILAETRTLASSQRMFGGAVASACLFGRVDFLERKKEVALALTMGVLRALTWLKSAGPSDILKTVPSHHWMGDRALYLGALEKVRESYSLDGVLSRETVQVARRARAMRLGMTLAKAKFLERSYTQQFTTLAKRKLNT